ncbi:MAG: IS630 family transposase [Synechococcaceae cyanobacterium SM2_3_2]|nr:IS630 family transposase [Synechococcaceae cyanobacterium SM2_3_2]
MIFIDETGFWIGMSRDVARSLSGKKALCLRQFYKGRKMTLIGAIKKEGVVATRLIKNSMKGKDFLDFLEIELIPKLSSGDVIIMDNLSSHKMEGIQELAEEKGVRIEYLPPYSSIEPERLVFIDETGFWVGMERRLTRRLAGEKAYSYRSTYKGKKTTLIGAIKQGEILVRKTIKGSMQGKDFYEFVKYDLLPKLRVGDVVVMDNLNSHHREDIKELIELVGARVEYLPVYSPEFNPIEMLWAKLKSLVRKFRTKTAEALDRLIKMAIRLVSASELRNWFRKCIDCSE